MEAVSKQLLLFLLDFFQGCGQTPINHKLCFIGNYINRVLASGGVLGSIYFQELTNIGWEGYYVSL